MEKFYSKVQEGLLLHVIFRLSDFKDGRLNISSDDEFLQCAALKMNAGQTFKPHKHIQRKQVNNEYIPQESWHVISGRVKCIFYDIDDTIIARPLIVAGDTSFTFRGGHTYEILDDNSKILEWKSGPYFGQQFDKVFI